MSNLQAVIIALGIVAAAIVFSQNTTAQTDNAPNFLIASGGDRTVWRIDTRTGNLQICGYRGKVPTAAEPDLSIRGSIRCDDSDSGAGISAN